MNRANRVVSDVPEEETPKFRVVAPKSSAIQANMPVAPLVLPSRLYKRPYRLELATLGWEHRAFRLAREK